MHQPGPHPVHDCSASQACASAPATWLIAQIRDVPLDASITMGIGAPLGPGGSDMPGYVEQGAPPGRVASTTQSAPPSGSSTGADGIQTPSSPASDGSGTENSSANWNRPWPAPPAGVGWGGRAPER